MSLVMPKPEDEILKSRTDLIERLRRILPADNVIDEEVELRAYECDALTMYRQLPLVVVLPETVEQVSRIMALAAEMNVKVVPRGGGTSLSGGSLPLGDGILLAMGKFNSVLELDYANRCACTAGRHQSRDHESCRAHGPLSRSRPLRRSPVRSVAMSGRTPVACIASNTVSRPEHPWPRDRADGRRGLAARWQASRFGAL